MEATEMDVLESSYYQLNKILMSCLGHWPYQDASSRRRNIFLLMFLIVSLLIPQVIKLFESTDDLDLIIECITPTMTNVLCILKFFNCALNANKMKSLLDHVRRDWKNASTSSDLRILRKYADNGRKMTKLYSIYIGMSVSVFCSAPFAPQLLDMISPLNESRPLRSLYEVEYYIDHEKYFYPILVHAILGSFATMLVLVAVDSMHMSYVEHACGIFSTVSYQIEHVTGEGESEVDLYPAKENDIHFHKVCECILLHKKALEFVRTIESAYTVYFLLLIGINVLLISLTGVHTVSNLDEPETVVRFSVFTAGQLLHILCNSVPGQRIIDHSLAVSQSVYMAKWYTLSLRTRKLLLFFLMRSSKPSVLTAGKFYLMSVESFCTIIQTSMSYFTVVSSTRG